MDPTTALKDLMLAAVEGDREAFALALESLASWHRRGGFMPSLPTPDVMDELQAKSPDRMVRDVTLRRRYQRYERRTVRVVLTPAIIRSVLSQDAAFEIDDDAIEEAAELVASRDEKTPWEEESDGAENLDSEVEPA